MKKPNDWTEFYFVPNGIVTYEDCPVCGAPDMRVEHGRSARGSFQHYEYCTECGASMPILLYDCEFCKIVLEIDVKPSDWKPGDWWPCFGPATTDAEAVKQATAKLGVPEKCIEILRTGGGVLARERQEDAE